MTPIQFLFPYFLDIRQFNAALKPLNYQARIVNKRTDEHDEHLSIEKIQENDDHHAESSTIKIEFREFMMVQDQMLLCWRKYENGLFFRQFQLDQADIHSSIHSEFIDIASLEVGKHVHTTSLSYNHLVTFIRKGNLAKKEDYHEQYVIVILHLDQINIIPFESFNESGGDPLYMWPALATLDPDSGKLYGLGMRMGSFTIELDKTFSQG